MTWKDRKQNDINYPIEGIKRQGKEWKTKTRTKNNGNKYITLVQ